MPEGNTRGDVITVVPIWYTTPGVGIPVTVTFGPNVTDALQLFKVVEMLILVAVIVGGLLTVIDLDELAVPQLLVMVYLMVAVPAATPVTTPVDAFTVATDGVRLLQLPPLVPLLVKVAVDPTQTVAAPLTVPAMAAGFTVITLFELNVPQLLVTVYLMVELPAATPVTTPVDAFTVATDVLRLSQLPPVVPLLVYVVVAPAQIGDAPLTVPAFTAALTVIDLDELAVPQLLVMVYLMVAVPAATPVTTPVAAFTVATDGVRLLQLPPVVPLLVKVAVDPTQTVAAPLTVPAMAAGFTVITLFELNVPQLLVTVYLIVELPAATPVTTPVDAFTVATDVLRLSQLPPVLPLLVYVVVVPAQIGDAPLTVPAFRIVFTVID